MSRKTVNGKLSVRCDVKAPSPYLRRNASLLERDLDKDSALVVDLGCGNGRNSGFMRRLGFRKVLSFDRRADHCMKVELGRERLPVAPSSVDVILANYVMMFLDRDEVSYAIGEIKRIANLGCRLVVELHPAKSSHVRTKRAVSMLQKRIVDKLGWSVTRESAGRFIAERLMEAK